MKYFRNLLLSLFINLFIALGVNAASGSISATTSSNQAVVGSTFNVTVKVSCSEALGSWQFGIAYDNQYISLQSGDTSVASYGDGSSKVKTYTYKFKAIKSGKANVRITGASMVSWSDVNTLFTPSVSNTSITVKTQAEIEASYSKDNTLKSLSVSGYELSPSFDKNVGEYSITVPDDVTSVNVNASVNDSRASLRGTGTINVSEGSNKIEVVVTAQNGSIKTYTINVTVKDLNPITPTIDGEEYSVVKKTDLLVNPVGFSPTTVKINGIDVPAFYSDIAKLTLVGLKKSDGEIKLYIYDNNEYTLYNELKSSSLTLYPVFNDEDLESFVKKEIEINGVKFQSYYREEDDLTLIYAMNIENGNKAYFNYDKKNNSFVEYNSKYESGLKTENKEFLMYLGFMAVLVFILLIICIICIRKNNRLKKILKSITEKTKEIENIKQKKEKTDSK